MDFKQKYLKYKIKYLELKNQIGGNWLVEDIRSNSNSIKITNLPHGTTLTHLEDFLIIQDIPIVQPGLHLNNGKGTNFLINFTDNATAIQQRPHVIAALAGPPSYNPSYATLVPIKAQPDFTRPWDGPSKILYIALPIAQSSKLGVQIDKRFNAMGEQSPFKSNIHRKLISPHISLFSLYIRTGSDLDNALSNSAFFTDIARTIKDLFIETFWINRLDPVQLHSKLSEYESLGPWITRTYADNTFLSKVFKDNYTPFTKQLVYILLTNLNFFPLDQFTSHIKVEVTNAAHTSYGSQPVPFTHYSMSPHKYPDSEMAVSSWYEDEWKPHISLIKNHRNPQDFIKQIKLVADKPISYVNLWSVDKTKMIPVIGVAQYGSLEYIYCSYDQQFTYEKI